MPTDKSGLNDLKRAWLCLGRAMSSPRCGGGCCAAKCGDHSRGRLLGWLRST